MKAGIEQSKTDISKAKARQAEASREIKRIEKDMKDFDSNKDSKLAELQSSLSSLKKAQIKNSVSVKALQKEVQSGRLEAEQAGADFGAAQDQLAEVDSTLKAQDAEIRALQKEQAQVKVRFSHDSPSTMCLSSLRMHRTRPRPVSTMNAQNLPASIKSCRP